MREIIFQEISQLGCNELPNKGQEKVHSKDNFRCLVLRFSSDYLREAVGLPDA